MPRHSVYYYAVPAPGRSLSRRVKVSRRRDDDRVKGIAPALRGGAMTIG
jgi:hypothetical protein